MGPDQNNDVALVTAIFDTTPNEIQCDIASDIMSRSAEQRLSSEESQAQFPTLWQHFRMCPDCYREYQMLVELIRLEDTDQLVEPTTIPTVPVGQNLSWLTRLEDALTTVFAGFQSATAAPNVRGETLGVEPVQLTVGDGRIALAFDVERSEQDPQQRDFFCLVEVLTDEDTSLLEAAPVWLQLGDDGPVLYEATLDELGETVFVNLPPARYTFWLRIGQQRYGVKDLIIP